MIYAAVRHEPTRRFCYSLAPGLFRFCLQTAKDDMRHVWLFCRDKYLPLEQKDTRRLIPMKKVACDGIRDYYEAEIQLDVVCLRYCFKLEDTAGIQVYFSHNGFDQEIPADIERMFDCPQILREEEQFVTPQWAQHKVIYQIFPARFATTKEVDEQTWYQAPITNETELGGNLAGITAKLPYIRELGAEVLYLTPIFRSNSVHKYDTIDYYQIDPSFGTEEDLIALVNRAHILGLRVILDAVFNHSSVDFFAFRDLKEKEESSPYRSWYYPKSFPLRSDGPIPTYTCFGYYGYMPKLNQRNPETAEYFINVGLYWLRKAHIDGWRLDVGDEVVHGFWRKFRTAVKAEFPDALIVGEVWHEAPDFLEGGQWDSLMNYPFYRAVMDFAARGSISASRFLDQLGSLRGNTPAGAYPLLWNIAGSHDTPRLLHNCGGHKGKHRLAAALQLLMPGMPMIYYGDEVGLEGAGDPDCRRGMLWDKKRQDQEMLLWYKALIRVRKENPAITQGEVLRMEARDEDGLILITRLLEGGKVTLLFHCGEGTANVPQLSGRTDLLTGQLFRGTVEGYTALALRG